MIEPADIESPKAAFEGMHGVMARLVQAAKSGDGKKIHWTVPGVIEIQRQPTESDE